MLRQWKVQRLRSVRAENLMKEPKKESGVPSSTNGATPQVKADDMKMAAHPLWIMGQVHQKLMAPKQRCTSFFE
ncbi:hypothetical protein FF1_025568 [Malus domestica]